jgi:RNA polymerase sigma-70 factor (ECF subfamily)
MSTSTRVLADAKTPEPSSAAKRTDRDATPRETDARLVAALLRQEPAAADALYARYASRIYGLGLVLLKDRADAEDLVQDTFLKVWRTGSAFDPRRGSLDVWILLTARSLAIDLLRRRTLETRRLSYLASGTPVSDEPGPERHAEQHDLIEHVLKAMHRLPPRQRSAVALAYLGERSSTQVAKSQGIPPGTVKSRIRAGIATLRRTLGEEDSGRPPTSPRRPAKASRSPGGDKP